MNTKEMVDSYNTYVEEHDRLDNLIVESEKIWEDRTYQIAGGGLTVSFSVFSLLSDKQISFDWQMVMITGLYAACLLLNYISHRVAINTFRELQDIIDEYRLRKMKYDEESLSLLYSSKNKKLIVINALTQWILVFNVLYTLLFTFIKLS